MKTEVQIKVIDRALENLKADIATYSLCCCIKDAILEETGEYLYTLRQTIPLFTRVNAVEFGKASKKLRNESYCYWWDDNDYENRRLFLLWIKEQLQRVL